MYYKLIVVIFLVSIGLFISSFTAPIDIDEKLWEIILYIALGGNVVYCYRLEKDIGTPVWPTGIFIEMFTKNPVLMFGKGVTFLFALIFLAKEVARIVS